jgi:RND family efflux transporter MFP subunit
MNSIRHVAWCLLIAALVAACGGDAEQAEAEQPTLDVTSWTEESELFMEHPPLVGGQTVRFAVHLTRLADFSAVNAGRTRIEMTPERGGPLTTLAGPEPLRPGVFRVEGALPAAGRYRWVLIVDAPNLSDRHDLGTTMVFAGEEEAVASAEQETGGDPAAIAYLKEQQWTNEFATAQASEADMRASFRVPARLQPVTGGEAIVSAPAAGRFAADALVSIGTTVRAGQVLGRLEPRLAAGADRATLAADVAEATADVSAAQAELARAERLLAEQAVPARRVEDARRALTVAEARLGAAEARLEQRDETLRSGGGIASGNAFVLRAPIAGRVSVVAATLGASYDEGAPLFTIVKTDELELQALVPAADVALARNVEAIALEIPGQPDPIPLRTRHMHDSGVIDEESRALTVQFEVDNPGGRLLVGQTGTAVLYSQQRVRLLAVPRAAVLMEAGRPYVFVQIGGEQFSRRFVDVAARDGDLVGLTGGIARGDRVVVKGAYDVQLASAATGLAAEGHVH